MNPNFEYQERSVCLAEYILKNNCTVRAAAAWFGISNSTVHKDITERLRRISPGLYAEVKKILEKNKAERHLRGGEATRVKYLHSAKPSESSRTSRK